MNDRFGWSLLASTLFLVFATPGTARAQARSPAPAPAPIPTSSVGEARSHWYGGQILVADAAALAVSTTGAVLAGRDDVGKGIAPTVALLGLGGWVLSSPFVHAGHRQPGRALASLAMRTGGMAVSALTGMTTLGLTCLGSCEGDYAALGILVVGGGGGLVLGALAASAVDAAALAYMPEGEPKAASSALRVLPVVGYEPVHRLPTMGLSGAF